MLFAQANDIWGFLCLVVMVLYGGWQIKENNKNKLELAKLTTGQTKIVEQQISTVKKLDGLLDARVKSAGDQGHAEGVLAGIDQEQKRVS
jgi:hypothetical protein